MKVLSGFISIIFIVSACLGGLAYRVPERRINSQTVYAAETTSIRYEEEATQLSRIGVFVGTDSGFELDRPPTRLEGLIMLIRLLGAEEEAMLMSEEDLHFTDVPDWGKGYVAYAYENGLTQGISDTAFGSDQAIQAKSYMTFLLRALGYDDSEGEFAWAEALDFANEIGLITDDLYTDLNQDTFLRDHVAKTSFDALATRVNQSNMTLVEHLSASGSIDAAVAGELFPEVFAKEISTASDGSIVFVDEGLEAAIRDHFGLGKSIYPETLSRYQELALDSEEIDYIGSLEDLKWFTTLEALNLEGEAFGRSCDIASISGLTELTELAVIDTGISGDLASIGGLKNLDNLSMGGNSISGDLEDLAGLTNMRSLRMHEENVTGDIRHMEDMTSLEVLWLQLMDISGDIEVFGDMDNLRAIRILNVADVYGDVGALEGSTELREITLQGNDFTGDIAALEELTQLMHLSIPGTGIGGDISGLGEMENLRYLELAEQSISGDISYLEGMDNLEYLILEDLDVTGDIDALAEMEGLTELTIRRTGVGGDISSLGDLNWLWVLVLMDMDITGDIGSLSGLQNVGEINLSNTNVYGHVDALQSMTNLEIFIADGTDVEGTFEMVEPDYLDVPVDGVIVLSCQEDRVSIAQGTRVKALYDHLMTIDGVTEVSIWHDDGSNPSDSELIAVVHNITITVDGTEYLVRIDVEEGINER